MEATEDESYRRLKLQTTEAIDEGQRQWKLQRMRATDD